MEKLRSYSGAVSKKRAFIVCLLRFVCILLLVVSCKSTPQIAQQIPVYMFIHNKSDLINKRVIYKDDGSFEQDKAKEILAEHLYPIVFLVTNTADTSEPVVDYQRDMTDLDRTIDPIFVDFYTKNERSYVLGSGNIALNAGVGFASSASYDRVFEYEITPKNPQVRVTYVVNPQDLIREYVAFESEPDKNKRVLVLFTYEVFAPQLMYEHLLTKISAKLEIAALMNAESGMSATNKVNMSNTFILRKYNNPEYVIRLIRNPAVVMFKISNEKKPTYFTRTNPRTSQVYKFRGKFYSLTPEYARHLNEEHVQFEYLDPSTDENAKRQQAVAELSDEALQNILKLFGGEKGPDALPNNTDDLRTALREDRITVQNR